MRILMLHGVGDVKYPASVFEQQLRHVQRTLKVVPLVRIVESLAQGASPDRQVALTFDDGFRTHLTVAYPILRRLGIPATFFVCPGLIESGRWLWNVEARERLRTLRPIDLEALMRRLEVESGTVEGMVEWMKGLPTQKRLDAEEQIRCASPHFRSDAGLHLAYDPLTWDDLAALDPDLITIGSHSMTHPNVSSLDADELDVEIRGSRRLLEARLGRPVPYFCLPNGAYDLRSLAAVRESYTAAVSTEEGFVAAGSDPYLLRRIPVASSIELLAWRLHRPWA